MAQASSAAAELMTARRLAEEVVGAGAGVVVVVGAAARATPVVGQPAAVSAATKEVAPLPVVMVLIWVVTALAVVGEDVVTVKATVTPVFCSK